MLGCVEVFVVKNNVFFFMFDGIGMGLGFIIVFILLGVVCEFLGIGKVFNLLIILEEYGMFVFVFVLGVFIVLGYLIVLINSFKKVN